MHDILIHTCVNWYSLGSQEQTYSPHDTWGDMIIMIAYWYSPSQSGISWIDRYDRKAVSRYLLQDKLHLHYLELKVQKRQS